MKWELINLLINIIIINILNFAMTESSIVYEFRKSLFNFLGTIKLYYNFDLAFHANLDIIV